jgi:hypothetical protein
MKEVVSEFELQGHHIRILKNDYIQFDEYEVQEAKLGEFPPNFVTRESGISSDALITKLSTVINCLSLQVVDANSKIRQLDWDAPGPLSHWNE